MDQSRSTRVVLPKLAELSSQHSRFLDEHFKTPEDLSTAPQLFSQLSRRCADMDADFLHLQSRLTEAAVSWISRSFRAKSSLQNLSLQLENLSLRASQCGQTISGGIASRRSRRTLGEELGLVATELRRIDNIREYVETALKLEALVGELEDAVFCARNRHSGGMFSTKLSTSSTPDNNESQQERLCQAINVMADIEEVITNIEKCQPKWSHLFKSVDARVDRVVFVLRQETLAEHRTLLASLGWPPKLTAPKPETWEISGLLNPLVLMHGDKRNSYSRSFQVLCALQHQQSRRELRKSKTLGRQDFEIRPWAIDELVSPIASRVEYHFLKWVDQPQFIFALVYKLLRDFIVGISDILQPLIDRARLLSCSAKEAWVSAMVNMLSGFLERTFFPSLAESYKEKDMKLNVISCWLHLVDLMVAFDKQMQSLLSSEGCLFLPESERSEGLSRGLSVLRIFCDRSDWLKMWAKIEVKNAWKKLKADLKDARVWVCKNGDGAELNVSTESDKFLLCSREDHRAPFIADSALTIAREMIDRCQTLSAMSIRAHFIRSTVPRFLWCFFNVLLLHCKKAELSPNHPDDDALVRVCQSVNAARYVETRLQEWSDDVSFVEMRIAENDSDFQKTDEGIDNYCFFWEEIKFLSEFQTRWLMEILGALLRQFETLTWAYTENNDHSEQEQNLTLNTDSAALELDVSFDFIAALDSLRRQLDVLKMSLNPKDFLDLWRSVADGLDHFICCSIITRDFQFSSKVINQFRADMQALFLVFQPFCACPQAFFPSIRETLKLFTMSKDAVKHLQLALSSKKNGKGLQCYGFSHLSFDQVDNILRNLTIETYSL